MGAGGDIAIELRFTPMQGSWKEKDSNSSSSSKKSVQVTGLGVKKELQISLEQLKTNFKKHEVTPKQKLPFLFQRLWLPSNVEETEGRR